MTLAFLENERVHYSPRAVYRYHLRLSRVEDYLGRAAGVFLVGNSDDSAFGFHSGGSAEGVGVAFLRRQLWLSPLFKQLFLEKLFALFFKEPVEHINPLFFLLEKAEVGGGHTHSRAKHSHVGDNVA